MSFKTDCGVCGGEIVVNQQQEKNLFDTLVTAAGGSRSASEAIDVVTERRSFFSDAKPPEVGPCEHTARGIYEHVAQRVLSDIGHSGDALASLVRITCDRELARRRAA